MLILAVSKKNLGKLIKEARKVKSKKINKKYTQRALAKDIGKSQSYIGDIEAGRTYPSFKILNEIAEACGVDVNYLLDEKNINENIDKFIKLQIGGVENNEVHKMREELKQDPDAKIDYIYNYLDKNTDTIKETGQNYMQDTFETPEEALKYILKQPALMEFCDIDISSMSAKSLNNFIDDLLSLLKLVSYKYKK